MWQRLGPESLPEVVDASEAFLHELALDSLNVSTCRHQKPGLKSYLARMPVDLTYWQLARECARLLDDRDWIALSRLSIEQLSAYALDNRSGEQPWQPAVVLHPSDIEVLAEQIGARVLWMRYLSLDSMRHLLVEASLTFAEGTSTKYYFDLLPPLLAFNRDDPDFEYPGPRRALIFNVLEAAAIAGDPLALTGYLNIDIGAGLVSPVPARRALYRAWKSGVLGGGVTLAELCLAVEDAGCEDDLLARVIEDLTDNDIAEGWALQAGRLMTRDGLNPKAPAVKSALDKASALGGKGEMHFYLGDVLASIEWLEESVRDALVEQLWQTAARSGSGPASLRLVLLWLAAEDDQPYSDEMVGWLDQATAAGVPLALHLRAFMPGTSESQRQRWLNEAATKGLPDAQLFLGLRSALGNQHGEADRWLRKAALGGHPGAMRALAQRHLNGMAGRISYQEAERWLHSGMMLDDVQSVIWLSALYFIKPELVVDDPEPGWSMVEVLLAEDGPEAAGRVIDTLVDVAPFNRDPDLAVELAERLTAMGHADAGLAMAERFSVGDGFPVDFELARSWYLRVLEQGEPEAAFRLGSALIHDHGRADEGFSYWQVAAEAGSEWAANDLAYCLCTGELGSEWQPERGMVLIQSLIEQNEQPHHYMLSTLAACQAAGGDFDRAVPNQRQALERTEKLEPDAIDVHEAMRRRLALYEQGQPYRVGE